MQECVSSRCRPWDKLFRTGGTGTPVQGYLKSHKILKNQQIFEFWFIEDQPCYFHEALRASLGCHLRWTGHHSRSRSMVCPWKIRIFNYSTLILKSAKLVNDSITCIGFLPAVHSLMNYKLTATGKRFSTVGTCVGLLSWSEMSDDWMCIKGRGA